MIVDNTNQKESTLIAIIAQLEARGKGFEDTFVQTCYKSLKYKSSRQLIKNLYKGGKNSASLRSWARSL
jgi:hypothetical protein